MGELDKQPGLIARWGYKVITLTDTQIKNSETALNNQGQKGFEVVSAIRIAANENVVIFKRLR